MTEATFPPHPYAGYSSVTYLFETSPGRFRSRDSLGSDISLNPGELQWTMAGKGIMHEEVPLKEGVAVEGLKVLVNLSKSSKKREPVVFHLALNDVPQWSPSAAISVNVLTGRLSGVESPLRIPDPFSFFDVKIKARMEFRARVLKDSGALIYVVRGKIRITCGDEVSQIEAYQAVGAQSSDKDEELMVDALEESQFIFLSGKTLGEPIVAHGPFVMNQKEEIAEAIAAYQRGEMGKLTSST